MNILLTSAGRRAYIIEYFKACPDFEKVYAANSTYTIALKRADDHLITPLIYNNEYIPTIIDYCLQNNISVILSLFDIDLLVLARHLSEFEENGIQVILAPAEFVEKCNDKWKTYEFINEIGLQSPKTYLHIDEVMAAIRTGELSYPIIMKPRWGMGSMSIYKVFDQLELITFTNKCQREIFDSYLKYESSMTPDEAIIYQELMNGQEYGLDVLNDLDGHFVKTFAKKKIAMRSGETDLGETVNSSPFKHTAMKISQNSGHRGILSVDCFIDEQGVFVTEMNCRISGHYPLAHLAGFNYPQVLADWLLGKPTDPHTLQYTEGLTITKELVPTIL